MNPGDFITARDDRDREWHGVVESVEGDYVVVRLDHHPLLDTVRLHVDDVELDEE